MSRLARDLAALPEMSAAALQARWEELEGAAASAIAPALLRRLLAQRLQERRYGALPALVRRELLRTASAEKGEPMTLPRQQLSAGTRLVREWNGRTLVVEVTDRGFEHAGRSWRSLTGIARHVTGTHCSGPRFFGLTARG